MITRLLLLPSNHDKQTSEIKWIPPKWKCTLDFDIYSLYLKLLQLFTMQGAIYTRGEKQFVTTYKYLYIMHNSQSSQQSQSTKVIIFNSMILFANTCINKTLVHLYKFVQLKHFNPKFSFCFGWTELFWIAHKSNTFMVKIAYGFQNH